MIGSDWVLVLIKRGICLNYGNGVNPFSRNCVLIVVCTSGMCSKIIKGVFQGISK